MIVLTVMLGSTLVRREWAVALLMICIIVLLLGMIGIVAALKM